MLFRSSEPLPVPDNPSPNEAAVVRENFIVAYKEAEGVLKSTADYAALYPADGGRLLTFGRKGDPFAEEVRLAKYIASGSFNDVFRAAEDGRAARISRYTGNHNSILLDAEGRHGSELAMQSHPDAIMIPKQHRVYRNVTSADPRLNGKTIEIVDFVDFKTAEELIKRNVDKQPTPRQAYTYSRGVDALNDKGYVLADGHGGNYTFGTNKAGNPVLIILDPGAVVKAAGNTLAEQRVNARAAQGLFDRPPADLQVKWGSLPDKWRYRVKKELLTGFASETNTPGPLEGLLDLDIYSFRYPEQIPMVPIGAERYPRMRDLSGLSADDAKRKFELMQEEYLRNPPKAPEADDRALLHMPGGLESCKPFIFQEMEFGNREHCIAA